MMDSMIRATKYTALPIISIMGRSIRQKMLFYSI